MLVKSPPAYTVPPLTARVRTVPLAFGFQARGGAAGGIERGDVVARLPADAGEAAARVHDVSATARA